MNVTLVYHGRYVIRQALELETLAAILRNGGHSLRFVYEPDVLGVTDNLFHVPWLAQRLSSPHRIAEQIVATSPDVVIFSILPSSFRWSSDVATLVKQHRDVPAIAIGLHPSLVPQRVLAEPCFDYVVQGEVENVMLPLLDALISRDDVASIHNLWYRGQGAASFTSRGPLVDLDALPLPDKTLFIPYVSHRYSYAAIVSRGCPYDCSFCEETCAKQLYGPRYFRRKRVETVMDELRAGKRRFHYREVIFKDSYLSGSKAWLAELMHEYRREIGVPFKCFCTVKGFDRQTAQLLKDGGCYSVEFGLQTWNPHIRHDVLNRRESNEQARAAFAACAAARLWYDVDHMFNLPNESEADHCSAAMTYHGLAYLNRVKVHHLVYLPTAPVVDHGIAAAAIPADARRQLAEGTETDFYDQSGVDEAASRLAAAYAALYKVLPILPAPCLRWLLRNDRVHLLRRLPGGIITALQALIAIRSGDLRFLAYAMVYPRRVLCALRNRLGKSRRPLLASTTS